MAKQKSKAKVEVVFDESPIDEIVPEVVKEKDYKDEIMALSNAKTLDELKSFVMGLDLDARKALAQSINDNATRISG